MLRMQVEFLKTLLKKLQNKPEILKENNQLLRNLLENYNCLNNKKTINKVNKKLIQEGE